ncbi:MAG: FAD-binding oxidoreductase [Burkholderiales bacterium]|nr:FAD-binding oxidoreductase [Burkholderiales bacterium]
MTGAPRLWGEDVDHAPSATALGAMGRIVGAAHLHTGLADRLACSRDRLPLATFAVRSARLPGTLPCAVVRPGSHEEIAALLRCARAHRLPIVPYGAGSGVLGGAIPLAHEVVLDLKRLNRITDLNEIDGTVTVQCGMNGGKFEAELNARGWTSGHLPQSLHMSTVGGWAACRGAGQASSRYGKIEDMVLGLRAVLPDGNTLDVRPVARRAAGPSVKDIFVGSEGVFGIITEVTLRIWRLPEHTRGVVLALPTLDAGWTALREIMQSELRPAVVRLYDEVESKARTDGIAAFEAKPFLCMLVFSGMKRLAELETELALDIVARHGGEPADDGPYHHWVDSRYRSYSPQWQARGHYMDTIEITGAWSALPAMYAQMRAAALALHPAVHFGAHWSHVYPEGACQYMTVRLPPMDEAEALALHDRAWCEIQSMTLALGGSVSHHHGVGAFRNAWLRTELNAGLDLLQRLKDGLDPDNLVNPGKLGLRAAPGARSLRPD